MQFLINTSVNQIYYFLWNTLTLVFKSYLNDGCEYHERDSKMRNPVVCYRNSELTTMSLGIVSHRVCATLPESAGSGNTDITYTS